MSTNKLEELLLRWEESRDEGHEVSVDDLCRDSPDLADALAERIVALRKMDWLRKLEGSKQLVLSAGNQIDEYRLVARIGRGGFSEVWEAADEGGRPVALKFIPSDEHAALVEYRAAKAIEDIRHPHLLPAHRIWESDGYLIVAMELADRTLLERWNEARREGQPGILSDELIEYFRHAAEAIDFLHGRDIHHRDIKPQNLLLVGKTLKVADFGLVRLFSSTITGHTGSLTIAYSAPEFFDGKTTRSSDQYCLAATYVQMRGGRLPFEGTLTQMMAGHLAKPPDLSGLPESERPVVAKALAKRPEQRWPSCSAFVQALAGARPIARRGGRRFLLAGLCCLPLLLLFVLLPGEQESPPLGVTPKVAFVFDGKSRIVSPLERFVPATLEAWVYVEPAFSGRPERTIIGSDIPTKSGVGIGFLFHDRKAAPLLGAQILPAPTYRDVPSNQPLPLRHWSHVAAVFSKEKTTIFLDGKPVARGAASANLGGTPFVVGNAGKENREHHFIGKINGVRISSGERYSSEFRPTAVFEPDETSLLIYDASKVDGTKATDLSGKGNHGVIEGVNVSAK